MENNNQGFNELNCDIPNFGSRQEMDIIRENEYIERQERLRRAAALQRKERLRQRKLKQLKETVTAWAILIFIVISVIAIIVGIVSASKDGSDKNKDNTGDEVREEILNAYTDFENTKESFTGEDYIKNINEYSIENISVLSKYLDYPSYYALMSDSTLYKNDGFYSVFTDAVRDCPQFSNGYIWSSKDSMKHPVTDGYLYDTNASFICAVSDICLWQTRTDFLYATDKTSNGSKDVSSGLTVLQKLEKAADYFFDKNDLNGGGIRYNENDSLVYVLTSANSGKRSAKPSNVFLNHSFGYLDLYNNLMFYRSMNSLDRLYTAMGDNSKAAYYKNIASKNKKAITDKFLNNSLGRYVGYIDADGKVHDLGFTALNLMAIAFDAADKETGTKILSWIDGETKINTDTVTSEKVFKDSNLPVFNTVCALDDGWFDRDGTYPYSGMEGFGKYWQNGDEAFASMYFSIGAANKAQSAKKLVSNVKKFNKALKENSVGEGEDIFAVLCAGIAQKNAVGINTDGEILYVAPKASKSDGLGIKNINFANNSYGFMFKEDKIFVTAELNAAVKIKIGSYDKDTAFKLTVVENGKVLSEETVKADKDGYVSVYKRFGSSSFAVLEKEQTEKKK